MWVTWSKMATLLSLTGIKSNSRKLKPSLDRTMCRRGLRALPVVITTRKANDRAKGDLAQKRGGGQATLSLDALTADQLMRLCEEQPDPHMAALIGDEWTRLLQSLEDPALQRVVLWKLEGLTNSEISELSGCTRQTIQRRLRLIREIWENS
jgi:DNA-directed RNA polymerase specialized sigma24 family protein